MRVAILSLYPRDPDRIAGGVRAAVYYLVQGLHSIGGLDIHVVHCHSDITADADVQRDGASLHFRAMPRRRIVPNLFRGVSRIQRELRSLAPDVVHAHVPHYAVAAIRAGFPTIYTVHGVQHREAESYRASWFDRARFAVAGTYDRFAVRRADRVVAISEYVLGEYRGLRAGGWERIDNPVADEFFSLPRREERDRVQYVGSITEVKGLLTLLRAVARARLRRPSLRLHLAGRATSPRYAERLREFVRAHDLEDTVRFEGLLNREALLAAYSQAAVVVLPSRQENAPLAVIEAMASGVPVVATRVGGVPDLVAENETGYLFPSGDDQALAAQLLDLLADDKRRWRLGQAARRQARRRFRADAVAQRYHELYRQVGGQASEGNADLRRET